MDIKQLISRKKQSAEEVRKKNEVYHIILICFQIRLLLYYCQKILDTGVKNKE